jgi:hypothetical protein
MKRGGKHEGMHIMTISASRAENAIRINNFMGEREWGDCVLLFSLALSRWFIIKKKLVYYL